MTNDMAAVKDNKSDVRGMTHSTNSVPNQYYPVNDVRTGKFVDEVIAAAKDDRMNTKRVISADIASTARVQSQNERVIEACERELRRKDLSEERRGEVFRIMGRTVELTAYESTASRNFQREQMEHSHKLVWRLIGIGALIIIGGVGCTVFVKSAK